MKAVYFNKKNIQSFEQEDLTALLVRMYAHIEAKRVSGLTFGLIEEGIALFSALSKKAKTEDVREMSARYVNHLLLERERFQ